MIPGGYTKPQATAWALERIETGGLAIWLAPAPVEAVSRG